METIKVIKFKDITWQPFRNFMDEYFAEKGWELQLVFCQGKVKKYQIFYGSGVTVDGKYEYAFPQFAEEDEVLAFAKTLWKTELPKTGDPKMIDKIDEVMFAMQAMPASLLCDILLSTSWNKTELRKAFRDTDIKAGSLSIYRIDNYTSGISFSCNAHYYEDEITGIINEFYVRMAVRASYDERTGKLVFKTFVDGGGILLPSHDNKYVEMDVIFESYCKGQPIVALDELITDEFDLKNSCGLVKADSIPEQENDIKFSI